MPTPAPRLIFAALLALAGGLPAQKPAPPPKPAVPAIALAPAGLAGQSVIVLPMSMLTWDTRVPGRTGPTARAATLRWADSLFQDMLSERAPEVSWVFPPALRRTASRAGGLVPSPDKLGQSVMRNPGLKETPDPLRSYIRQILALSGGARYALIPAALMVAPAGADSLAVELSVVMTDGRVGKVVWRTLAPGRGETLAEALQAALATIIPSDASAPTP